MVTPPRMVELQCPACASMHWEIDHDVLMPGVPGPGYSDREYRCPQCGHTGAGYAVKRKSPAQFFLQSGGLDPMNVREFAEWLGIFREHFPSHEWLGRLGVGWYPGERQSAHDDELEAICWLGKVDNYWLRLSDWNPAHSRPRVHINRGGSSHEASFWLNPIELESGYGFAAEELESVRDVVAGNALTILAAWERFQEFAKAAQEKCLKELQQSLSTSATILGAEVSGCRTKTHESPIYGRVLEVALVGREGHERPFRGGQILQEEVGRYEPQVLVINLLEFDSDFGNALIAGLVNGAQAMNALGTRRRTRILAAGETAGKLDRALAIMKIESLFAGRTYSDLESALSAKP